MDKNRKIIHRLRIFGFGEAFSWLLLLFFAMPMKYIYDKPEAVRVVGWIHGVLFILYILQLLRVKLTFRWSFSRFVYGCIAAFLPFGTLWFDKKLRQEEARVTAL